MDGKGPKGRGQASAVAASSLARCETALLKFRRGSAQHTLLVRRIAALRTACALLSESTRDYTRAELEAALPPLRSIAAKCEKARSKYGPDAPQRARFDPLVGAMEVSLARILQQLEILGENGL